MNPIKVTKCPNGYAWRCILDDHAGYVAYLTSRGAPWTLAQAADNGRAHFRRYHLFQPGGYVPGEPDQRTRQALLRAALTPFSQEEAR